MRLNSYKEITIDDYEPYVTERATADFLDYVVYSELVGDFEHGVFPDPEDDDQDQLGVKMGPVHPEVTCTFIQALRDVMAELSLSFSNEHLKALEIDFFALI